MTCDQTWAAMLKQMPPISPHPTWFDLATIAFNGFQWFWTIGQTMPWFRWILVVYKRAKKVIAIIQGGGRGEAASIYGEHTNNYATRYNTGTYIEICPSQYIPKVSLSLPSDPRSTLSCECTNKMIGLDQETRMCPPATRVTTQTIWTSTSWADYQGGRL